VRAGQTESEFDLETKRILSDPANLECTCPRVQCQYHGQCRECVALHRYYKSTPACLEIAKGT
jgi:hypothetical protein